MHLILDKHAGKYSAINNYLNNTKIKKTSFNFTTEAIKTKKKKDANLVGADVYIITEEGIPQFKNFIPVKCEFISNRGTKVCQGYVSPDLLMMKWYRSRFMATKRIQDTDVITFLEQMVVVGGAEIMEL